MHSNRRPDEEGIKTVRGRWWGCRARIPTADLMKKGLRQIQSCHSSSESHSNRRPDEEGIKTCAFHGRFSRLLYSNRRPDEEGIKTPPGGDPGSHGCIPTADLMKKGLRPQHAGYARKAWIPTADLMKKGLRRPAARPSPRPCPIPTADLMKKGLRPPTTPAAPPPPHSNRRPDEEGIKTHPSRSTGSRPSIPTADLMKKGLRPVGHRRRLAHGPFQPQT